MEMETKNEVQTEAINVSVTSDFFSNVGLLNMHFVFSKELCFEHQNP